jgi:hypothetical protein
MPISTNQALAASQRGSAPPPALPRLLIAGATGALGNAVLRRLVGMQRHSHTHAQGTLPEALKRGLASLDEHALAALGFERLLIVRTAQKPTAIGRQNSLEKLATWMLSIFSFMVPSSEQPVRATKVAELVDMALQQLPVGTWVAAPELVWQAAQGDAGQMRQVVREWFGARAV